MAVVTPSPENSKIYEILIEFLEGNTKNCFLLPPHLCLVPQGDYAQEGFLHTREKYQLNDITLSKQLLTKCTKYLQWLHGRRSFTDMIISGHTKNSSGSSSNGYVGVRHSSTRAVAEEIILLLGIIQLVDLKKYKHQFSHFQTSIIP